MPTADVECFDDRDGANRHTDLRIQRSSTSQVRKSQVLFARLTSTIKDVVESLCRPLCRRNHNKLCCKQSKSSRWKALKIFRRTSTLEQKLTVDLQILCDITLRNTDGRLQTLLLLKNMHSFIFYLTTKIVHGIYSKGTAILKPPIYVSNLAPMPHHLTLKDTFSLHLTKYAECMKCIQYIMEKHSFLTQIGKCDIGV